jgi:uncharacterized membrane protein YfcA
MPTCAGCAKFRDEVEKEMREVAKEIASREARRTELEYKKLTIVASMAVVSGALSQFLFELSLPHTPSQKAIAITSFGLVIVSFAYGFLIRAHRSELGIRGYLKIEKNLLIDEMPNIFQIVSLLGFLNVFLKELWVKVIVTLVLTFLLLLYLTSKRNQMIARSAELEKKVTSDVTVPLSIVLGCIFGFVVYGIAWLISAQVR